MAGPGVKIDKLETDQVPYASGPRQFFDERGKDAGKVPKNSFKVGWTLRNSKGKVKAGFAFHINPQQIGRAHSSRSQLFATKGGFYVDNFGPGPVTITIRQLVAGGNNHNSATFDGITPLAREDVQLFMRDIYYPSLRRHNPRYRVFFHDNHYERNMGERVFFPQNAIDIQRSTDLHHVWLLQITMIGLEKDPYGGEVKIESTRRGKILPYEHREYLVKKGDTIDKLVNRFTPKPRTKHKKKLWRARFLDLNKFVKKKRVIEQFPPGVVLIDLIHDADKIKKVTVKPMHLHAGEVVRLPLARAR